MATWDELYDQGQLPSMEDFTKFIASPLWPELNGYLRDERQAKSTIEYSQCSAQRGWNMKYKKKGKSLCTLYPMDGYFIVLLVVNARMEDAVAAIVDSCCTYLQELYHRTTFSAGGRWLMIEVRNDATWQGVQALLEIREAYLAKS